MWSFGEENGPVQLIVAEIPSQTGCGTIVLQIRYELLT